MACWPSFCLPRCLCDLTACADHATRGLPVAAPQAALPAPGSSAAPDCGCTLDICDSEPAPAPAAPSDGALNPTIMCHLPFEARVQMCCSIFCATESAQRALVQRAGCNPDGFALDKE